MLAQRKLATPVSRAPRSMAVAQRPVVRRAGAPAVELATSSVDSVDGALVCSIDPDTWEDLVHNSDLPVLVDYYSKNCGPCKAIAPRLEEMAAEYAGRAVFTKLDCYAFSPRFASGLGIRALPTFHIWHRGVKLAEVTGSKEAAIRALLDAHAAPGGGGDAAEDALNNAAAA